MKSLAGKKVVITGVTRGLGRSLAHRFAGLGHIIAGCGRNAKGIAELQRELREPHCFAALDVTDEEEVSKWAKAVLKKIGPPDLLINNAALINPNKPLWEVSAKEFSQVIDVNIKGAANVIRHFVPAMLKRKTGVIVNISSDWGRCTSAEVAPYCASKWAIEGLTQSLAQELPKGMAAVPLSPGIIDTDMLRITFGDAAASYPSPEEWAAIAAPFLLKLGPNDNGKQLRVPSMPG